MVIETNKLNPTTVVNSGTTQLDSEKSPMGGSLTRTSNVQKEMYSALPLKPANEKAKEAPHDQPQADSPAGKNMSVWTERTDLYQEFLDFGYNKGEIKVSEGPFNQLIESYPEKSASRKKLDEIKSLINDNPIWDDTFKGRKKKIQLSRRVNAVVDTAIKVRKQLEKITPEAMEAKQEGFKQEANKAHPEDSSKAEEVSTQRYKQWLEDQGSECKALTKKINTLGKKAKEGRVKYGPGPSLGSHNKEAQFVYREMEKLLLAHKHKLVDGVKLAQKSSEYRVSSFEDIKDMAKELLPSPPTSIAALKKAVVNAGLKTEQKVRGIQHAASKLSVQEFKVHHIVNDPRMASIVRAAHAEMLLEIQGVPFETSSFSALIETLEKLPFKEKKAVYEKVGALLSQPSFNTESQGLSEKVEQALESVSFSSPEKNERLTAVRNKSFESGSIQKTLEWIKGLINDGGCETEQNRKALIQAKALLSTGLMDAALEQLKGESEAPKEGAGNTAPDGARHRLVYFTTQLLERTKKLEGVAGRIENEISKEGLEKIVDKTVGDWSETSTKSDKKTQKKAEEFDFAIDSLKKKSIPTVVSELGRSATLLRDAVDLVTTGEAKEFESAGVLVKSAASQATSTADELRFSAAEKAGKDINPFSKRSRIAKDMAIEAKKAQREEAKKQGKDETMLEAPDAREVQAFLKDNAAWKELQSADDPDFIHLASRVAKEWGLALEDRTVMPSTPEECANQEKAFLQFMSDLGQRKALRGIALALLEDKVDIATLGISKLIRSLSTVLIGGITTYMKVNNVDEGVMPGNDYPYKERQQVLYKNLQQVATRLILSMLPNSAQAAIGGGAAIVGRAYNARVDVLGEGQKHKLQSLIDAAAHQAVISAYSDGVEAVVDAHTENLTEGVAGDDPVGGNDNTSIDDNDEVAKLERYPGEVKTWQYEGAEGLSITIEGTEEYYHHVSSVLDELAADTEMGEKLQQALKGKPFSIHFPKEVEHDGISVHPASIDLDNNIIYFDPLNTLSHDSESGGGDQPKLTLAHELIHRLDKDNLRRDDDTQPFTAEEKRLLEAMAVGAIYKTPDGQEVDFSDPEVKKKYLKEGAPIFTVNQLRDELGIEERLEYTEGDNSAEGRLHFQHPGNSNLRTEVSLYRSWKTLEKQIEETQSQNTLNRLNAQLEVVNNQMARFKGEVPNIERLAYAKLWLAEAEAGSFEENIAEQYLEQVNWNIEQGWNAELDQEYSRDSDSRVLTVDEFKRETIEELRAAYFTGDRVKAYALILSKLESVNEKLENRDWEDEEELQALLEQKNILTNAEATFINQATFPGIPEVRYLFLPGNVEDIEAAARSYYENMDSLLLPDGTVVTPEEQRALIDMYGGPEEFAEHMRMAHEHNKVLSMSETLTPDQFLLMIAERTLEENGRLPPEGIDASFLDKKIMVRFDHVKRTWTSGDDFEQDEWSTEKEFTAREILLGKHKQYAKSLSPAAGNGHCSVASMTSSDQEIAGLERELGSVRVQNEYMDHVDDLKGNSQFMGALQHRLKTQLYQRLTDLGADKGQLVTVGIDHQPDSLAGHSGRLNMNSVFAIRNDDGTFTFFSLLTDKTFTTTKVDESAWENERKGEIEAQGWLKDPSSEFNKFMSAHIDPKERFSASDYELKLDFFDRGAVLNQRCEELGLNQGDLVDVGINYQPDSHTINRGPLGMDSVFAVKNDDGTLTFFSLYSDETFTTTKVDDEDSQRNEQEGMAEAHRALRDPRSKFHSFMTAHIVPEESSYKLQLDLAGHQSEELSQRREELGLNQGDLVSVGINDQQDGHFGHSRRLNMDSVFAVRNDDGTLTFFSQSSDETFTTTKVDDENSWRNEQEGMKEAYYWLRDPNSEFYRFMSAHIEPEDRLSSLGHDLSGYDLRLNLVDHQNEDALLGKNTENFMDFMKNWMDVNSRSEGEEFIEALSFWVNELGKAWTAATDFLPLPIKFMARMGFTIVQGSLNMANTETIAERDEAGRNMGYSMGKVTAFSAASGTANPKAMTNFKVFPGPTPADKVFTAREHTANVIGRGPVVTGTQWGGAQSADDRIRSTFKDPDKGYTPASQPTAATKPNEVLDFGTTDEIWSRMMNGEPQSFETVPESPPATFESFLQGAPDPGDLSPEDKLRMLNDKFDQQMHKALGEDRFSNQNDPNHEQLRSFLTNVLSSPASQFGDLNSREFLEGATDVASDSVVNHILPKLQQAMEVLNSGGGNTVEKVRALFA